MSRWGSSWNTCVFVILVVVILPLKWSWDSVPRVNHELSPTRRQSGFSTHDIVYGVQGQHALGSHAARVPLGVAYLRAGKVEEASQLFRQILATDSKNLDALVGLGHSFFVLAGVRDRELFLNIEDLSADLTKFSLNEIRSLIERGMKAYKNVLASSPEFSSELWSDPDCSCSTFNNVDIHNTIGFGYWALGKTDSARVEFERALSLDPRDGDAAALLRHLSEL